VADEREQLLTATVDRMLGMVSRARFKLSRTAHRHNIVIAGVTIALDPSAASFEYQLERLASVIEATIAYDRASAMLAAAGVETGLVPLWLVTGSSVLAQWLAWSRGERALRRVLRLSDQADIAPVAGLLERTARTALGQTAVKIRVANGLAVAGKIELPGRKRCLMTLGRTAELTVFECGMPEALVAGAIGRSLSAVGDHPFFTAADLVISAARNEGSTLRIEVFHEQGPLAPVPQVALAVTPVDADPTFPWRPTRREVADLYALVDTLRGHGRGA
jgi:hypothetical protein